MNPRLTTRDSATKNSSTSTGSWNEPRFQLQSVKLEKARRSLRAFMVQAWPVLEPGTEFVEGIHIDAICAHLQAVTEGKNPKPHHQRSTRSCQIALDGCVLARLGVDRAPRIQMALQQLPRAIGDSR